MLIRTMETSDLARVMELEYILFSSPWQLSDFQYEIKDNPYSYFFVIEKDNYIIGYIGLWILYEYGQIMTLGIDPKEQGQGYGKRLMQDALALAKGQGCQMMSLEVRVSNQRAQDLYKSLGFVNRAVRKNYYQDNYEDAYLLVKRLEEEL